MKFTVGEEFTVITISFDPEEGPQLAAAAKRTALERYGRDGVAAGWHFLTGDEPAIRRVAESVGFRYRFDPDRQQYAHGAGLFLLTPQGKLSRYFSGIEFGARDLRLGLVEAAANRIGTATDHVLLLCYQYDPDTGKYGFLIIRVIRLAGTLTVLALVIGVSVMIRRDRRRQKPPSI
jgi:protein SCO1/2